MREIEITEAERAIEAARETVVQSQNRAARRKALREQPREDRLARKKARRERTA